MYGDTHPICGGSQGLAQVGAERGGGGHAGSQSVSKKCALPLPGSVYELVRDNQVQGPDLLFEAADGADRDDPLHSQALQGVDVGPYRKLSWRYAVSLAVA